MAVLEAMGANGTPQELQLDSNLNLKTTATISSGLTNPVFIANAEAGDTTGTFTNATQTTAVTATNGDGYATALVSINGTYAGASGSFQASDDGGTTWYNIGGIRSDDSAVETSYSNLTNTNRQWSFPISGNDSFRVLSSAVTSGTANVRISISAIPTLPPGSVVTGTVGGPIPGTLVVGQAKVSVTNTAVQLGSNALVNGVIVKAGIANTAKLTVGGSGVTSTTDGTGNGYILNPGEACSFAVSNTNVIYINGTSGDLVSFEGN